LAAVVHARVDEVVSGDVSSFFLYGPGGQGKSYEVIDALDKNPGVAKWRHWNSRMTARALVDNLRLYPDKIHLFEDMESLYKDRTSAGILCSACASIKGQPRRVNYTTAMDSINFEFKGGVIIISNENLSGNAVLGAVASRMRPLLWRLQSAEIEAIIRNAAMRGATHRGHAITPEECLEVADFVITRMHSGQHRIDLRTYFDHALPSYWYCKRSSDHKLDWQDLVDSKIQGEPVIENRQHRIDREREIAAECYRDGATTAERLNHWKERTGHAKQAFYDRIKEAKQAGMFTTIIGRAS